METQYFFIRMNNGIQQRNFITICYNFFLACLFCFILSLWGEDFYPWVGSAILYLPEPITIFPMEIPIITLKYKLMFCVGWIYRSECLVFI